MKSIQLTLTLLLFTLFTLSSTAQEIVDSTVTINDSTLLTEDSTTINTSAQVTTFGDDEWDYSNPKEYQIGAIRIEGADNFDHQSILLIAGLRQGGPRQRQARAGVQPRRARDRPFRNG